MLKINFKKFYKFDHSKLIILNMDFNTVSPLAAIHFTYYI